MDNSQEQVSAAGGWVLWLGKGDLSRAPAESTTSFFPHFCMILRPSGMGLVTWGVQGDEWMEFRKEHSADLQGTLAGAVVVCCPQVASKDLSF